MRIVDASYEIIEPELQKLSIYERLEKTGRICYKSEDKITKDSAIPFCKRMIKNNHMSTMEMARLHFFVGDRNKFFTDSFQAYNPYLQCSTFDKDEGVYISGSVRGFYESLERYENDGLFFHPYIVAVSRVLNKTLPELFQKEIPSHRIQAGIGCIPDLGFRIDDPAMVPYAHRYIAVKFIVSRAVSHELVRHRPVTFLQESQRYCAYNLDKFSNEVTFINPKPFFSASTCSEDYVTWKQSCEYAESMYFRLLKNNSPQAARTVLPNSCKTEIIVYTNTNEWKWIFGLRTSSAAEPSMREVMIPLEEEMKRLRYI